MILSHKTSINEGNYFSKEVALKSMSASQVKAFLDCPAAAMADILGLYKREESTALLVGSYVDAFFSGTFDAFRAENPQIYTNRGELRADYRQADEIISLITNDALMVAMLGGEQQKIVTGEIYGVPFRGKLDSFLSAEQCRQIAADFPKMAEHLMMADGAIVDLKIIRDMDSVYKAGEGRVSFIRAWRYDLQLAIYQRLMQQLTGNLLPCFIVCATKEKTPDKAVIHIPQYMLDAALSEAEEDIKRAEHVKTHSEEAVRCGKCDYCKTTKILEDAISADELDGALI